MSLSSSQGLPEKAGVSGSTPSLATIFSITSLSPLLISSPLAVRIRKARQRRLMQPDDGEELGSNRFRVSPLSVRIGPSRY
jgi:hypothetical protein